MINYEMPIGLGMALAQNPEAMEKFAALSDDEICYTSNKTPSFTTFL